MGRWDNIKSQLSLPYFSLYQMAAFIYSKDPFIVSELCHWKLAAIHPVTLLFTLVRLLCWVPASLLTRWSLPHCPLCCRRHVSTGAMTTAAAARCTPRPRPAPRLARPSSRVGRGCGGAEAGAGPGLWRPPRRVVSGPNIARWPGAGQRCGAPGTLLPTLALALLLALARGM